jgi:hypothetical protein
MKAKLQDFSLFISKQEHANYLIAYACLWDKCP